MGAFFVVWFCCAIVNVPVENNDASNKTRALAAMLFIVNSNPFLEGV